MKKLEKKNSTFGHYLAVSHRMHCGVSLGKKMSK